MGRFTITVEDEIDTAFRIKAIKCKTRLNKAFEEAMKMWLEKDCENKKN